MKLWPFSSASAPEAVPMVERVEPTVMAAAPQNAGGNMPLSSGTEGSELYRLLTGGMSRAGTAVNEQTAMCVSAVYACVGLIGGAISSMPCHVYRRTEDFRERVNNPLWWLLNEQPWPSLSAAVFWEYLAWSLLLHGDAFARIHRASLYSPEVKGFEPLHPLRVEVKANGDRLAYTIHYADGNVVTVDQDDMLHVPGVGFNGLRGMSPLRYALRHPAGIALAADEFSGGYFRNGAKADYAIVVQGNTNADQVRLMQQTFTETRSLGNSFVPPVLSGGAKLQELTLSAEDAQLIETRKLQVEEIARIHGVPPFMIGHTEKTTSWGSGVEQMGIGFVKYTLQRHLVKIEQEINRKLFRTARFFAEFNTAGLERGDIKTRFDAYRVAVGRAGEPGWMDVDEIRQLENLPPRKIKPVDDTTGEGNEAAA